MEAAPAVQSSRLVTPSGSRLSKREILTWLLAAASYYAAMLLVVGSPLLDNDSYQYLSVTSNILSGAGMTTDIPFFESELRHGVIPAPVTTFPPGYPIAIAALQFFGLRPQLAAVTVSITSGALAVAMVGLICRRLRMDPIVSRYVLFIFGANASTLTYSISILSESLFTLVVTAALLAFLASRAVGASRTAYAIAILSGLAVGVATWVRYAGLFVFAGLVLALVMDLAIARTRRAFYCLISVGLSATVLIAPLIVRNILLTGTWRGGNTVASEDGAAWTLMKGATGLAWLAVGNGTTAVAVAAQITVGIVAAAALTRLRRWFHTPALNLVATVLAVYIVAIVLASLNSPIDIGARLLFPALPLISLTGGLVVWRLHRGGARRHRPVVPRALTMIGACAYFISGCTCLDLPYSPPHHGVYQKLAAPLEDGSRAIDWLAARNTPEAPVMATESQATSYALQRPVVGMAEARYSSTRWDEATVVSVIRQYHARYLILYTNPDEVSGRSVQSESPFLASLLAGRSVAGFSVAARSREVIIFEHRGR
ncbi:Dolichyl-phosphate-mannose-protein mannosyltransferase [Actinoplanes philippinensis]|uniref:Dolichyl-phosphate-mannose-protein mannosyltransferase n=1 Tax=Actinoplanes philippinensis TaxID=35752 RepID=A0A1I2IJW5_9ACTN|nr:phospholipid carrier-dependent glycosyltransferase [Actinoplanes philippinensis]SFF41337.1 Dolichyl-phosphate-mannose-protein mannosyltransferase [Actinoplanes philippinensis]